MNTNYLYDYFVERVLYGGEFISLWQMVDLCNLLDYHYNRSNRQQCPFYEVKYCNYDVKIYEV